MKAFEELFFAIFGQTSTEELINRKVIRPLWTEVLFKMVFGAYMVVTMIVLVNLLIAMMSDTYARIQAQSDIEWKYGLSKLVRSMHRSTSAPSPINLITTWLLYFLDLCKKKFKKKKRTDINAVLGGFKQSLQMSPRSKAAQKWLSLIGKERKRPTPRQSVALSVSPLSQFGSQLSLNLQTNRVEDIVDWELVVKKFRILAESNTPKDD